MQERTAQVQSPPLCLALITAAFMILLLVSIHMKLRLICLALTLTRLRSETARSVMPKSKRNANNHARTTSELFRPTRASHRLRFQRQSSIRPFWSHVTWAHPSISSRPPWNPSMQRPPRGNDFVAGPASVVMIRCMSPRQSRSDAIIPRCT